MVCTWAHNHQSRGGNQKEEKNEEEEEKKFNNKKNNIYSLYEIYINVFEYVDIVKYRIV